MLRSRWSISASFTLLAWQVSKMTRSICALSSSVRGTGDPTGRMSSYSGMLSTRASFLRAPALTPVSIYTLVQTARLNKLNPETYLRDILAKIADGHPINRVGELVPWKMIPAPGSDPPPTA